jgi:WS/DGAT/MGAT family acyltransferase
MGDGIGLLMVLLALTDREQHPDGDPPNPFLEMFTAGADFKAVRAHAERVMPEGMRLLLVATDAMRSAHRRWWVRLAMPAALLRLTFRRADPRTPLKGPLAPAKRVAWSAPLAVEQLRRLAHALGSTLNDVLVAAMAGGLGRYLAGRGCDPRGLDLRAAMPVNLRPLEEMAQLGNRFGLIFLALPVGIADAAERLRELRRRALALKRSAEPFAAWAVLRALGAVPHWVQRLVVRIFGSKATMVFTNVPGPRERLWFAGQPLDDVFFWVPQSGRLGMGISIMSYAGVVRLGLATDAKLIPDPQAIVAGFHAELAAMAALAGIDGLAALESAAPAASAAVGVPAGEGKPLARPA